MSVKKLALLPNTTISQEELVKKLREQLPLLVEPIQIQFVFLVRTSVLFLLELI